MKALAEVFKGIEFIRISNLPNDQKDFIVATVSSDKIIKILKDKIVLRDCLQYHDYLSLYDHYKNNKPIRGQEKNHVPHKQAQPAFKLAFK